MKYMLFNVPNILAVVRLSDKGYFTYWERYRVLKNKFPGLIKEIRGLGLINEIEFEPDSGVSSADVAKVMLGTGVLVVPAGPKVIRFVPPLIVSESDVADAMRLFEDALVKIQAENSSKKTDGSTSDAHDDGDIMAKISGFFNKIFSPAMSQ